MLNEFWATAPASYKAVVFSAMALIALGIAINIFGQTAKNEALSFASLAVIGAGLLLHAAGVVIRGHQVQKRLRNSSRKG
ncbi:DUF3188 domain-containing protein (plasmid) [Arthrobacter sp. FW306-05-C]|uniref:DUF3188 domain-containing protein n=2 Tax=Micrococcaceae TaxID=1268 RepID=A0ABT9RYQ9_9MICC|nr:MULTISPECIES: DUF3188 domain-containing protein [Micrococcaceae]MDP9988738.1 hypothetical protein [Arthrobacter oryzae]MDP9890385.1 hypothetical protein [Pseudarthrobacter enclensis]UKA69130.1 DUF3188 domain-containing protein [Arthrobacter sp. FW306-05-C]UKA73480.1 DUF3188 domain-containing protein [Arthrobacter sp. FW306-06-A]WJH26682.1 DUF3188 domain-containing protein [Pseudarthrobacter defluvii]